MAEHRYHHDPERHIDDPTRKLSFHIYGQAPVRADGRIDGHPFYFRARAAAWTLTVCLSHDIDASTIWPAEETPGLFQAGEYRGYFLDGDYGEAYAASFMRYDEAERIIRDCARRYLRETQRKDHV